MFDIVYSHSDFVVINKHPNVSVHKDDGDTVLVSSVAKAVECQKLYLVHRLDKMTSGLLILAKSHDSARRLSQLFAERKIQKFYLAIGTKKPKKKQGLIRGDMVRSRRSAWKLVASTENPAVTQFLSVAGRPGERVFICKPHTGKTHQIRVALNSLGSSIVGDHIYSPSSQADRGYLHAFALCFTYQGQVLELVCDPRHYQDFGQQWQSTEVSSAIDAWLTPWQLDWPAL
ncbi:TIGR01621 family pseudouridine synthase [Vibrio sp. AK197]